MTELNTPRPDFCEQRCGVPSVADSLAEMLTHLPHLAPASAVLDQDDAMPAPGGGA